MPTVELTWTAEEDQILAPYAQLLKTTVSDLIVQNGKGSAIQSAISVYANTIHESKDIPAPIADAIAPDAARIFEKVWQDWNSAKAFLPAIATQWEAIVTKAIAEANPAPAA